jgi:hypothetical protein
MATAGPNAHSNWLSSASARGSAALGGKGRLDGRWFCSRCNWFFVGSLPWNQKIDESDEDAFPSAPVVFSMFHAYDSMTAEQHVAACRTLVSRS